MNNDRFDLESQSTNLPFSSDAEATETHGTARITRKISNLGKITEA